MTLSLHLLDKLLSLYLLIQGYYTMDEGFGARGAACHVHIHRDNFIHTLDERIVIEHTAAGGAVAHGNDPFRLGHLVVEKAKGWRHLARKPTGNDHQIRLARAGTHQLHAKATHIIVGSLC